VNRWIVIGALTWAAPALAQDAEPTSKTRFYNFDELRLSGDNAKPNILYTNANQRATFERLFALKRSFLPELRRSANGADSARPPRSGR